MTKPVKKQEPEMHYGGLKLEDTGETFYQTVCYVIPDHWNAEAQRWKRAEARGQQVYTHSAFYAGVARMKAAGVRVDRRNGTLFSHLIRFILKEEFEKFGLGKAKKRAKARGRRKAVAK